MVSVKGFSYPELLERYEIVPGDPEKGYPTFIFIEDGKELARFAGSPEESSGGAQDIEWDTLAQKLKDDLLEQAEELAE